MISDASHCAVAIFPLGSRGRVIRPLTFFHLIIPAWRTHFASFRIYPILNHGRLGRNQFWQR